MSTHEAGPANNGDQEAIEFLARDIKNTRVVEWGQLFTNGALAVIGVVAICIYGGQLKVMQGQLQTSREQWDADHRAWVGLNGNFDLTKEPTLYVSAIKGPQGNIPSVEAHLVVTFGIKNVGSTPAFDNSTMARAVLTGNTTKLPDFHMQQVCAGADSDIAGSQSVVFPNTPYTQVAQGIMAGYTIPLNEIRRIWVVGCIAYKSGTDTKAHHTKFWLMSNLISDPPRLLGKDGPFTIYSVSVGGWSVVKTEAD